MKLVDSNSQPAPQKPTAHKAGETIEYVITYLEMTSQPTYPRPQLIGSEPSVLVRAIQPPNAHFLMLYDAVGAQYAWLDRHEQDPDALAAFVSDPDVEIYTYLRNGWIHGFFTLDFREKGVGNLAYLGLVPAAVGKGFGTWLLRTAVHMLWDRDNVTKTIVNTCTLDHPRALAHYQRNGFRPVSRETRTRVLTRDWDPAQFP